MTTKDKQMEEWITARMVPTLRGYQGWHVVSARVVYDSMRESSEIEIRCVEMLSGLSFLVDFSMPRAWSSDAEYSDRINETALQLCQKQFDSIRKNLKKKYSR